MRASADFEVAGWWPRTQRQVKSLWHIVRNGHIACMLLGVEKSPCMYGGPFSTPAVNAGEERLEAGHLLQPSINPIFPENSQNRHQMLSDARLCWIRLGPADWVGL
jgi:hypothetical protein